MPNSQTEGDFRLGPWVNTQKMHGRAGRLSRDRIARLEALPGWVWDVVGAAWEQALGLLQSYVGREGHARVPNQHTEDGFRLGSWVSEQRRAKKAGRLSPDRVARLEALPSWVWELRKRK